MNVTGIITEYNPFHKGHLYQLQTLKENSNTDYIIIAMSGSFLQRGTPAMADKYIRANMALSQGADLVLELPSIYSTASAEAFAYGGVLLLHTTGVVDTLCFGAESTDLFKLMDIAHILNNEPLRYTKNLQKFLKQGYSFPNARAKALDSFEDILMKPNNILAIEYLKAIEKINPYIKPFIIKRNGNGYHDTSLNGTFASATAIRKNLFEKESLEVVSGVLPRISYELLLNYSKNHVFLTENDFGMLLHYKLLSEKASDFTVYKDCSESLSHRIKKSIPMYICWDQFCHLLKTKDMTYTRISRLLTHILLDIKKNDYLPYETATHLPYLRVLGFKKEASPLLSMIKQKGKAPLISKLSRGEMLLSEEGRSLLHKDIHSADVYQSVLTEKLQMSLPNEYHRQIIVVNDETI